MGARLVAGLDGILKDQRSDDQSDPILASALSALGSGVIPQRRKNPTTGKFELVSYNFKVTATGGRVVSVNDGSALIEGQIVGQSAMVDGQIVATLSIPAADASLDRHDLVVLKSDVDSKGVVRSRGNAKQEDFEVIQGVAGAAGVKFTDEELNEVGKVRIAMVFVPNGKATVAQDDVFQQQYMTTVGQLQQQIKTLETDVETLTTEVSNTVQGAKQESDSLKTAVGALSNVPSLPAIVTLMNDTPAYADRYEATSTVIFQNILTGPIFMITAEPIPSMVTALASETALYETKLTAAIAAAQAAAHPDLAALQSIQTGSFSDLKTGATLYKAKLLALEEMGNLAAAIGDILARVTELESAPTVPQGLQDELDLLDSRLDVLEGGGASVTEAVSATKSVNFLNDSKGDSIGIAIGQFLQLASAFSPGTLFNEDFTAAVSTVMSEVNPQFGLICGGPGTPCFSVNLTTKEAVKGNTDGNNPIHINLLTPHGANLKVTYRHKATKSPTNLSTNQVVIGTTALRGSDGSAVEWTGGFLNIKGPGGVTVFSTQLFVQQNTLALDKYFDISLEVNIVAKTVRMKVFNVTDNVVQYDQTIVNLATLSQVGNIFRVETGFGLGADWRFTSGGTYYRDNLLIEETTPIASPWVLAGSASFKGLSLLDTESVIVKPVETKPAGTTILYDLVLDDGAVTVLNVAPNTLVDVSATKPDKVDVKVRMTTADGGTTPKLTTLGLEVRSSLTTAQIRDAMRTSLVDQVLADGVAIAATISLGATATEVVSVVAYDAATGAPIKLLSAGVDYSFDGDTGILTVLGTSRVGQKLNCTVHRGRL